MMRYSRTHPGADEKSALFYVAAFSRRHFSNLGKDFFMSKYCIYTCDNV